MVDAEQWLVATAPKLRELIPGSSSLELVAGLFSSVERPVEPGREVLHYRRLFDFDQCIGSPAGTESLPCLETPQGALWVLDVPVQLVYQSAPLRPWVLSLSQTITLLLGSTSLNCGLWRLHPGGVLRITEPEQTFLLAGEHAGQFIFSEEGVHMQLAPIPPEKPAESSALSELSIKLEFILHEQSVTLAQLNEFVEGKVLKVDPDAVGSIHIRAAGQVVAVGELVRLDEGLGVELRQVYRGLSDE